MTRKAYALLSFAVSVRIAAALVLGGSFYFVDEMRYVDEAHRLLAGEGFGAGYGRVPGYPVLLAVLAALVPSSLLLLRVAQAIATAGGSLLVYWLARRPFGGHAATVAALLYAADPLLVVSSGLLYPEAIAAVILLLVMMVVLFAARRDRPVASAVAGFLLGILAQFRPVALAAAPVIVAWIVCATPVPRARRALHGILLLVACLLTLAPWTYREYRVRGELVPVTPVELPATRPGKPRRQGNPPADLLSTTPADFARHAAIEFGHFWEFYPTRLATDHPNVRARLHARDERLAVNPVTPLGLRNTVSALSFAVELTLALVGLVVGLGFHRRGTLLLTGVILSYAFGYAVFVGKIRYRIPILPPLFVLAGVGAVAILRYGTAHLAPAGARSSAGGEGAPRRSPRRRPAAPVDPHSSHR